MPCRWKAKGFSSGEDCVSKMTGKVDDPQAFCYGGAERFGVDEATAQEFDACVDANLDKPNPIQFCADKFGIPVIHTGFEHEAYRHPDFEKIYKQFHAMIKDEKEAEDRYVNWVKALNLDETRNYADSMREQFKWVRRHVDFELWKEDSRAKYWMVEAAFPLESMNENIYTLDELRESTKTVKGKSADLNHKFPLPTIDIEAAKYEDGVAECVIRVPKNLMCPICDTSKTINELIEDGSIVNVSLEAVCTLKSDNPHKCEGMEFTGLALLTKDVLPGIPLTRLMPLEHIMVEALHTADETKQRRKRNVKKIEMKIVEEDCPPGEVWNPDTEKCEPKKEQADVHDCPEGQIWDPRANDSHGGCVPTGEAPTREQVTTVDITDPTGPGQRNIAPKAVYPDAEGQCPEGYILNMELGQCVLDENCPEKQHFDQKLQRCVPDTVPVPEHPETAVGTAAAPKEKIEPDSATHDTSGGSDPHERPFPEVEVEPGTSKDVKVPPIPEPMPEKDLTTTPEPPFKATTEPGKELGAEKGPHECPDGYHYDYDETQCVQDTPIVETLPTLEERIQRRKAERTAKSLKAQLDESDRDYGVVYKAYQQLTGTLKAYKQANSKLEKQIDRYNVEKVSDEVKLRDGGRRLEDLTIARDDYKHQLEKLKGLYEDTNRKYQSTLGTNLELSRKLTKSHEDYLELASRNELLEAKLKQTRNLAKKTLKIKV